MNDHTGLLRSLEQLQSNLSFSPVQMSKALQTLAHSNVGKWSFSEADCTHWGCDVGIRLRRKCRHWVQNQVKGKVVQAVVGAQWPI